MAKKILQALVHLQPHLAQISAPSLQPLQHNQHLATTASALGVRGCSYSLKLNLLSHLQQPQQGKHHMAATMPALRLQHHLPRIALAGV